MNEQKWVQLTEEILPIAEKLCELSDRYEIELPHITADADGYFEISHHEDGVFYSFTRVNDKKLPQISCEVDKS